MVLLQFFEDQALKNWAVYVLSAAVLLVAEAVSVQFVRFKIPAPGERVKTDGETEWEELDQRIREITKHNGNTTEQEDLACDKCGEVSPTNFETCWKCGAEFKDDNA